MFGLRRIQSRLLYKYILSYMLMFFIPLVIMGIIIYKNSVVSLREGIEQSNIDMLNQVKNMTDERMEELEKLALRISYDYRLTPFMVNDGFYGKEAIEELNKYKANSSIIKELFLYYRGDDNIYSANGAYSLDTFKKMYHFDQSEKIKEQLESNLPVVYSAASIRVNESKEDRLITYMYPITRNTITPYGTVMYLIEESAITSLIKDTLGDFQGNAYIFDQNNHVFTSSINDREFNHNDIKKLAATKNGVSSIQLQSKEYSVVSVKSSVSGWIFVTVMPANQFFDKVVNLQRFLMMVIISIVLSGIGVSILLGKKQYRPIHNLLDFLNKNDKRVLNIEEFNELDRIKVTMARVFKDHESLSEKVDNQAPIVRDQYLMRMLNGSLVNEGEINKLLESINLPMKQDQFFVAVVSLKNEILQKREEMIRTLSVISFNKSISYGMEIGFKDCIAIIVSMEDPYPGEARKVVEELRQLIRDRLNVDPIISAGTYVAEKSKINRSFIEALAALEYRFMNERKSITYFEDISNQSEKTIGYPKDEHIKFVQSLKQGDQIVAIETLKHIFEVVINKDLSVQMVKCICFDIINTVLKVAVEMGLGEKNYDMNKVVDFNSIGELEKHLHPLIIDICREVSRKNERSNSELCNKILAYIRENYAKYDLSLESIAQKFKLSTSYLSRFLKEQTGVNFTQYVWHLRIEEVKRKLTDTDETIKEIVIAAGYMDVANFTRKFKKAEGVTPGNYRLLYAPERSHIQTNIENDTAL
ncbi:helix-turn-helix domain-containing protein [Bacillus sp. EB106-08-02-XG196]|uniref:AraC family transcriptional regulator n=1 Tax=Bacillus sp. EB106-08-02-XG196 TaxID=2737049 RepID=UPI0015C487AC|nr:helix-turn-helix domain-containing protein [Bacillus sp. EB106-08-02-XG196]NWQ40746.1 helix-turn-helix domain-containing protein [Bacillus sp. EB106-08-02-XG196]